MTPLMLQQQLLLLLLRKGSITKQKFIAPNTETQLSCCSQAQQIKMNYAIILIKVPACRFPMHGFYFLLYLH